MLEKYKPTKFSEVVGNKNAIQSLGRWLLTWSPGNNCALVSGPCGVGKTLSIDILTKQSDYNVMEINTDDDRNETFISQRVAPFVKTLKNIWGKSNILIVNDIDVSNDNGFLTSLSKCLKETKIPIILTCNDRYEPKIKTIASMCLDIKYFKLTSQDICRHVTEIVKKEYNTNKLTNRQIQIIQTATEKSEGDLRSAIMNTEFTLICEPPSMKKHTSSIPKNGGMKDNHKTNLFEITTDFMSQMTDFVDKVELFNMEKDLIPLMVYENYPLNIMKTKNKQEELYHLSFASASISDYDLLPYECEDISIIQSTLVCHPKSKINFTGYLGKMSTKTKKSNINTNLESSLQIKPGHFRLDYMSYMLLNLYNQINTPSIFVDKCISYGFSKEDIQENISVILIAEGPYSMCNYSCVDKKIKASITKLFSTHINPPSPPPKTTKKTSKKETVPAKETTTEKKTKKTPAPTPTPAPCIQEEQIQKEKPTSTIVRKRATKKTTEPQPESSASSPTEPIQKEKPTSTIVRKKSKAV